MSIQLTEPPVSPSSPAGPAGPEPAAGKGSILRKVLLVVVILAAVGGAVWKIRSNTSATQTNAVRMSAMSDRPQPVMVAPVDEKTMPIYLTALGTVTPYYSVTIKSRVDGQLLSVNVREGQAVHKGQLLAEIDPAPYQAALAEAQGQLIKDEANAKNAQAEAERYTALLNAGVVSKESEQLQVSTAGQAQGAIAADQAAIQAAKVNLDYTKISSPIDGIVGLRQVDPGNIVHASDATGLLLVTQTQPIASIFTLPEDQLPDVLRRIRSGVRLPVEAWDRSDSTRLADGVVLTADNQIDPTTGTDKIKAVFSNKENSLFPNQFVNIRLILEQRPNSLVVPASAIQTGSDGTFVFLLKKGVPPAATKGQGSGSDAAHGPASGGSGAASAQPAESGASGHGGHRAPAEPYYVVQQPVTVDVTEGTQVILASGLQAGDQVVVDGQEKLLDGSRVTPRTAPPAANGHASTPAASGPSNPGTPSSSAAPDAAAVRRGLRTAPGAPGSASPHPQHAAQ